MKPFVYQGRAQRVVFGAGSTEQLGAELNALGLKRPLLLCTPTQRDQAEQVAKQLGDAEVVGVFDQAVMHVPIETVRQARTLADREGADCTLAVGGGSTIGLGKAIALESGVPIIAVPTTYAGSEMTPIYGITEASLKKTGNDLRVLPAVVIYDSLLSMELPVALSITSGINAIAHAAEGLYARDGNPVMDLMAQEGIRALAKAIPVIHAGAGEALAQAREEALYGAWLCGSVLGNVGMALHHKLCHTLGGSCNLPHAEVHTVMLPHALAYNALAAPDAMERIATALGSNDAAQGVFDLALAHGAPTSLRALGMRAQDLDRVCDIAMQVPYPNPRPLEKAALRTLLQNAFEGLRPDS
jgi:alcohol dehydrogenase class IV